MTIITATIIIIIINNINHNDKCARFFCFLFHLFSIMKSNALFEHRNKNRNWTNNCYLYICCICICMHATFKFETILRFHCDTRDIYSVCMHVCELWAQNANKWFNVKHTQISSPWKSIYHNLFCIWTAIILSITIIIIIYNHHRDHSWIFLFCAMILFWLL